LVSASRYGLWIGVGRPPPVHIAAGDREKNLPHQIVERFVRRADGELEPLTERSAKPIAEVRTHASPR
jgi:hypothetical protein